MQQTLFGGKWNRNIYLLTFLFFFISSTILIMTDRFELLDFQVYYKSSQRILSQEQVYQRADDGHFIYKYSPYFALSFSIFSIFPILIAKIIFLVVIALCFASTIQLYEVVFLDSKLSFMQLVCIFIVFSKHLQKELYLGQVNILILYLVSLSIYFINTRWIYSCIAFIASLFIKPIALVLLPFYFLKMKLKTCILFLIAIVASIVSSILFFPAYSQSWFYELYSELASKSNLESLETQTVFVLFHRLFRLSPHTSLYCGVSLYIVFIALLLKYYYRLSLYIILAMIPLLVCTSNNFYIVSMPLFIYLITRYKSMSYPEKIVFAVSSLLMCGNQYEFWGREVVNKIDAIAPYAISVCLCLIFVISLKLKNLRQTYNLV